MANPTIRNQPNLTGLPPNAQREFEFLRSYAYKLLGKNGSATQASTFQQESFTYNGHPIFTLARPLQESTVQVFLNGVLLRRGKTYGYLISGRILEIRPTANALDGDWIHVTGQETA